MAADLTAPAERLRGTPGVQRVPSPEIDLFICREFLSGEDCAVLCDLIDQKRRPSTIADDQGIADFRTSETCDLDNGHGLVAKVRQDISRLLGIPLDHGEPIQGQRYSPGQEFRPHTDTFNPGSADFYRNCAESGQRSWTAMIYLNRPAEGGATRFKLIGKTIQPETGKLLAWNNLLADASPNPNALHQGMKVRRGTKYILTQWFRELPFH